MPALDLVDFQLPVSSAFGQEDGPWKLVHRHADPITTRGEYRPLRD
jgi:hypothetical protein